MTTLPEAQAIFIYLSPFLLATLLASLWQMIRHDHKLTIQNNEIKQRIYESQVLQQIGEKIGYELDIAKILDTIITSLSDLVPFTAAGYMLIRLDGKSVVFKVNLHSSVNQPVLDVLRDHLLEALNKISPIQFNKDNVEQEILGAPMNVTGGVGLSSLWVVPMSINTRGLGAMIVASTEPNLYHGPEMDILLKLLSQASHAVNNLEKIVASEKEKLNAMVLSMADGVLMIGKNLDLVVINPAAVTLLGLSETPQSKDVFNALADKLDLRTKIEESQANNSVVTVDSLIVGEKFYQLFLSGVFDSHKNRVGTVIIFHDTSSQKQLERIREEFTAMMVHELRAPLTVVRGATDMFLKNPALPAQTEGLDLLKTLRNSADDMLALVNDLLDVAKIESGKFQILKVPGNIADTIKDRITFFNQLALPKSIKLVADLPLEPLSAQFDPDRISQVLNNLLSNAIKFTSVGGSITVSASKNDQVVVISVTDTGRGIPGEEIPELFSKFRQLHWTEHEKGTGLGLVIAKGIVESHGGTISVVSKVNEGTTFSFTIPTV